MSARLMIRVQMTAVHVTPCAEARIAASICGFAPQHRKSCRTHLWHANLVKKSHAQDVIICTHLLVKNDSAIKTVVCVVGCFAFMRRVVRVAEDVKSAEVNGSTKLRR